MGRTREVELFRAALDAVEPPFALLYLHGPGGIGKTSLLDVLIAVAEELGAVVVRVDGRDLEPAPRAILEAAGAIVGIGQRAEFAEMPSGARRVVLLLDSYERLEALDGWIRDRFLPALPASCLLVIAGRKPPASEWLADPVWRGGVEVVGLRNLSPEESREFLEGAGVGPGWHDQLVATSHGHPLGLSLLADVVVRGGTVTNESLHPNLVATLLQRFLDVVPSGAHRRAVEVCGLARVTTEALLRDALELDDAHELFSWLRGLSFVESGPEGLFPHDLARDAIVADLHWRDREVYERLFRGIRTHVLRRLSATHGREQQRVLLDAKFMHRYQPQSRIWTDWDTFGRTYPEPAQPQDRSAVLDLATAWEGPESAALAERWWFRQPDAFQVIRSHDGEVTGFLALLDLTRADPTDVAADPAAAAAWRYAQWHGLPRPGDAVTQTRFAVDRKVHQGPSATMNLAPVLTIQQWMSTAGVRLGFITTVEPERWDDYFAFFEIRRVDRAEVQIGGHRYGLFVRDFRAMPLPAWLELMLERDLTGGQVPVAAPAPAPAALALSRAEFEDAVRRALRDLLRRDLLARNPLVRSRLVLDRVGDGEPGDALAGLVREAAERMGGDPRDDKLRRVFDRTFLRPAPTQEKAAEVLDLPLSTYKRHLRRGVHRLIEQLWEEELRASHRR